VKLRFNTLALNRTASTPIKRQKAKVTGKGTKIEGNPALLKRANKKAIIFGYD